MSFTITTDGTTGNTLIPNDIILNYILKAGGEHVKIYLYLLMASQNPGLVGSVSVELLADRLELTERDVIRMLRYWEREGLLSLTEDANGQIIGLTLLRQYGMKPAVPAEEEMAPPSSFVVSEEAPSPTGSGTPHLRVLNSNPVPERTQYTAMQIEAISKDVEMQQTLSLVEQALGSPISPTHMQLIMYLICDLDFPGNLIVYLYEMGASRQKTTPRYLETIAIDWSKKGIQSVADAMAETADYTGKYRPIQKALGIHRDLAPAEKAIIDSWDSYHFSTDILTEACKRTVLQSGDTNLNYVGKILEGWHSSGVKSFADIATADEAYRKNKKSHQAPNNPRKRLGNNAFQNFRQRDYSDEDYEVMERQFLQRKGAP